MLARKSWTYNKEHSDPFHAVMEIHPEKDRQARKSHERSEISPNNRFPD